MQTRSFKHARILIIDDEPANVELLQRLLGEVDLFADKVLGGGC